jgi:hypothetical protein
MYFKIHDLLKVFKLRKNRNYSQLYGGTYYIYSYREKYFQKNV